MFSRQALRAELEKLDAELESLNSLPSLSLAASDLERQFLEMVALARQAEELQEETEILGTSAVKHDSLAQRYGLLQPLRAAPQFADTRSGELLIAKLFAASLEAGRETARCKALSTLAPTLELKNPAPLAETLSRLSYAHQSQFTWADCASVATSLRSPPALEDVQRLEQLCRAISDESRIHQRLDARARGLGRLRESPVVSETAHLRGTVIALQAAEVARAAVSREHLALSGLAIPPKLVDLHPLTELMSQLDEAGSAIASHRTYIFSIEQDLTTLTVQLKAAEKFASVPLVPIPADRKRIPSPLVLAVAVGAIGILVIFVLFSPILLRELGLHPTRPVIDSTIDQVNRKTDPTGTHETGNTPPPDTVKNDRHEKSVPRVESGVTPERLESVRRLIRNADIANEKGMYLQAALGYGEAALLYPQELLQVERPERTKVKFLEALKRYQAQVEHSLDKASSEDQKGK